MNLWASWGTLVPAHGDHGVHAVRFLSGSCAVLVQPVAACMGGARLTLIARLAPALGAQSRQLAITEHTPAPEDILFQPLNTSLQNQ